MWINTCNWLSIICVNHIIFETLTKINMRYAIKNAKLVTKGEHKGMYSLNGASICKEGEKPQELRVKTAKGYYSQKNAWARLDIIGTAKTGALLITEECFNSLLPYTGIGKTFQTPEQKQEAANAAGWVYLCSKITDPYDNR